MHDRVSRVSVAFVIALASMHAFAHEVAGKAASRSLEPSVESKPATGSLPCKAFTHPPKTPHDPNDLLFTFDQLEHWYRVPGEFTHRLDGDKYGFETMSFIVSETHPGGGPGLHVHDAEEAHVLLHGTAQYRIGEKTFTVQAPYIAKVPAGVPHTFINAGAEPFNLVAVFATKHPSTTRVGPNPLIPAWESRHRTVPCEAAK